MIGDRHGRQCLGRSRSGRSLVVSFGYSSITNSEREVRTAEEKLRYEKLQTASVEDKWQ
ncbi:unnamed protein product, partial [Nesidiocoris tenuis]